jgi:peptide/nickel transport system substrate-binding protein
MERDLDNLVHLLSRGIIERRRFVMMAIAMGLAAPAAVVLADRAVAATPKKGGRFRLACGAAHLADSLDPAFIVGTHLVLVNFGQLRNCLAEIAPDGKLIPELAESWEASPDAKVWIFKLRKGVEFHNGKSLTAEDVVASLNHHRGEESRSAAKDLIKSVTDIKAGNGEIAVTLAEGNADFPYLMSDFRLVICPANAEGGIDWQSGTGTGGYVLESFDPGVRAVTKRNPNYWKEGRAHFDEVETLVMFDTTAQTNALNSGEIEAMGTVDLKTVERLKSSPDVTVLVGPSNSHASLPMIASAPPFDNNDVRLALKYAIDREEWLTKVLRGYGSLGNDHPIGPANRYRATADEIPQRVYDPDKARFHLKKAGLDTLNVQIHVAQTSVFDGAIDGTVLYQQQAKGAGIDIEVVRMPDDNYWDDVWRIKPWCVSVWAGRATEDWMFTQVYSSGASWNESKWDNEKFNALLVAARAELDESKRRDMYVEMQRILHVEGSTVIPFFFSLVQAVSNKVQLPETIATNLEFDGARCAERWSFA